MHDRLSLEPDAQNAADVRKTLIAGSVVRVEVCCHRNIGREEIFSSQVHADDAREEDGVQAAPVCMRKFNPDAVPRHVVFAGNENAAATLKAVAKEDISRSQQFYRGKDCVESGADIGWLDSRCRWFENELVD